MEQYQLNYSQVLIAIPYPLLLHLRVVLLLIPPDAYV